MNGDGRSPTLKLQTPQLASRVSPSQSTSWGSLKRLRFTEMSGNWTMSTSRSAPYSGSYRRYSRSLGENLFTGWRSLWSMRSGRLGIEVVPRLGDDLPEVALGPHGPRLRLRHAVGEQGEDNAVVVELNV